MRFNVFAIVAAVAAVAALASCSNPMAVESGGAGPSADSEAKNIFYLDKGWKTAGLSREAFDEIVDMANVTARIYGDLWDDALSSISPWLIPSLDFSGNSADFVTRKVWDEAGSGFYAEALEDTRTGDIVLAFRGTNALSVTDWVNNAQQALSDYTCLRSEQYSAAVRAALEARRDFPRLSLIAGHSLGGGLAQLAALRLGMRAVCFNSAGLASTTIAESGIPAAAVSENAARITHVNVRYDPLSDLLGRRDGNAPFPFTRQYGGKTLWLRNVTGTGFAMNPLRIANHMYHAYVWQLSNTYKYTGNFM